MPKRWVQKQGLSGFSTIGCEVMTIQIEPGALFKGRYEIIRCLGVGGMGAVYLARDPRYAGFFVALKILYPSIVAVDEHRERFRNEIIASYRINHEHVVRAYEYFDEPDFQAYAMEYVDGGDLAVRMARGAIPAEDAFKIVKQIAMGLDAIHAQSIIHRDLKPENVLLATDGRVKISDFGVARLRGANTLTKVGAMVGTPKYLSPEYIELGECDPRGDLFALGVISYEMLAGKSPFTADSGMALMIERFKTRRDPLEKVIGSIDPVFSQIIEKAMAIQVTERYQSAAEMLRDLDACERGELVEIRPPQVHSAGHRVESAMLGGMRMLSGAIVADQRESAIVRVQRYLILALTAIAIGLGIFHFRRSDPQHVLSSLPAGRYLGSAHNVLSQNRRYPLQVWRTGAGTFVTLGKEGCAVSPLDEHGVFTCGDLHFLLEVRMIRGARASGEISELGWGSAGTFALEPAPDSGAGGAS